MNVPSLPSSLEIIIANPLVYILSGIFILLLTELMRIAYRVFKV